LLDLPISLHFKLELSCTAHELLNERRAGALCSPNSQFEELFRKFEAAGIQLDQFGATLLIRQWELDRLVNATRSRSESWLKLIRAVCGKDEYYIGILTKSVHLIE
jgi:hypothetical protein